MLNRKEYKKQWRKDNPEKEKQYNINAKEREHKWYEDNKKRILKQSKQDYLVNKGQRKKYLLDNKERIRKRFEQYHIDNKEKIAIQRKGYLQTEEGKATNQRGHSKRRARERLLINTLTAKEWEDILEKYNYICAYCGVEFNCELLPEKDHIIPISKGGHNIKENIVPACRSCNAKKYNKIL